MINRSYSTAVAAALILLPSALCKNAGAVQLRRKLSYMKIGTYEPTSQVTDAAALDQDQLVMEGLFKQNVQIAFDAARVVYGNGGHSESYAVVTLKDGLSRRLSEGTQLVGLNSVGEKVYGTAYSTYSSGTKKIAFRYKTNDDQSKWNECHIGGLPEDARLTTGCLATGGTIAIDGGASFDYSYNVLGDNNSGRTFQALSFQAKYAMYSGDKCVGCPYTDFKMAADYYGKYDYANKWMMAAFNGEKTEFRNGNGNFAKLDIQTRSEVVMKSTVVINLYQWVIGQFEYAAAVCDNSKDDALKFWDTGASLYTGSSVVTGEDSGYFLYTLANDLCQKFNTCGPGGDQSSGKANVNIRVFDEFSDGRNNIQLRKCDDLKYNVAEISTLMSVPLIQGTIKSSFHTQMMGRNAKEKAAGAAYAAAILPRLHHCSPTDAAATYDNMKVEVNDYESDYVAVKAAFENNYACLRVSCQDIGGLVYTLNPTVYHDGLAPCGSSNAFSTKSQMEAFKELTNSVLAMAIVGSALGGFVLAFCCLCFLIRREKKGNPMFSPSKESPAGTLT